MEDRSKERIELIQGTLDMLILRTLMLGASHGHGISKYIERASDEALRVEHGSLYPALHRLEKKGLISSRWETPEGKSREVKMYYLTAPGRKHLVAEESRWEAMARAIVRVLRPA